MPTIKPSPRRFFAPLLLLATFFVCLNGVACYNWEKTTTVTVNVQQNNVTVPVYSIVEIPAYMTVIVPEVYYNTYFIINAPPDSPLNNACVKGLKLGSNITSNFSCTSYFCDQQSTKPNSTSQEELDPWMDVQVVLMNYCMHCNRNMSDILSFQTLLQNNASQCRNWEQDYLQFNRCTKAVSYKLDKMSQPATMCLCDNVGLYGSHCDSYTSFFIFTFNYVRPWILFVLIGIQLVVVSVTLCIPEYVLTIRNCMALASDSRCSKRSIRMFLTTRIQIIVFLFLAVLFLALEQIASFAVTFYKFKPIRQVLVGSTLRIISILFTVACYSALLVFWASIMDSNFTKRRLALKHTIMLSIFYVAFVLLIILVLSLAFIKSAQTTLYGILSGVGIFYLIIFPIGLSVYAIRIYLTLRKTNTVTKPTDLKMIRFLLATNVMFVLLNIMAIIGMVMSFAGWDILGAWIGLHRTIFIDLTLMIVFYMIVYLSYYESTFMALFGPCLKRLGLKKGDMDEEEEKAPAPRKHKTTTKDEDSSETPAE